MREVRVLFFAGAIMQLSGLLSLDGSQKGQLSRVGGGEKKTELSS